MSNNQQQNQQNQPENQPEKPKQQISSAKTNTMDLEKLKKEYSLQLNAYKQAVADYTNYLQNSNNTNNSSTNYVVMPGKQFWGTGQADSQSVYNGVDVEKCKALCSSTSKCTGATFNPDVNGQAMCWLRTGEGDLTSALDTDNAIIPEGQKYLLTIESINNTLIKINQQIQQIIKQSTPLYDSIKIEDQAQNKELIKSYTKLIIERDKIEEMLKSYQDLDESEKQGEITITQQYYSYILLVVIVLGAIILLYSFSGTFSNEQNVYSQNIPDNSESSTNKYYIILIIIIVILIITSYTNIKTTAVNVSTGTYNSISSFFSNITAIFSSNVR